MTLPFRRLGAVFVLSVLAVTATGCATPQPEPTSSASAAAPAPAPSSPSPTPDTEESSAPIAAPTCDTIISEDIVSDFESIGWTALADDLRIGEDFSGGVQCMWGDFSTVSDHVQIFGWAPITTDEAHTAQDALLQEGWTREDGSGGVYITESPETAVAPDDDGYGITYFFGDGYVIVADTKQGLLLIEWPPA